MNVEVKDGLTVLGVTFSVGGLLAWVKAQFRNVEAEKIITRARILDIEKRFATSANEPILMSFKAHDHICSQAQELMLSEFRHVTSTLEETSIEVKSMSDKITEMSVTVGILKEKVSERRKHD